MARNFDHIKPGDTLEVTVRNEEHPSRHRIVVGAVSHDRGRAFFTSNDGKYVFFDHDDVSFEVVSFADGLPLVPVIVWYPGEDGLVESAAAYGHPGNGVWMYRGQKVLAKDLLDIIGPDNRIYAFVERD